MTVFVAIFGVALWTLIAVGTLLSMFIELSKRARRMNERLQRLEDRVHLDLDHLRELHEHAIERSESFAQQLRRSRLADALDELPPPWPEGPPSWDKEQEEDKPRVSAWKRLRDSSHLPPES